MPHILVKISKFVFENSRFQIVEAFQSLFCDGDSVVAVNKPCSYWATIIISYSFHWYQQKVCNGLLCHAHVASLIVSQRFGFGKMIKFTLKMSNIFYDVFTSHGKISLCHRDGSAQIVMSHNYSTQVSDPFRSSPTWSPNDMIVTDICQYIMCPI